VQQTSVERSLAAQAFHRVSQRHRQLYSRHGTLCSDIVPKKSGNPVESDGQGLPFDRHGTGYFGNPALIRLYSLKPADFLSILPIFINDYQGGTGCDRFPWRLEENRLLRTFDQRGYR
jgi:hypothetical protein